MNIEAGVGLRVAERPPPTVAANDLSIVTYELHEHCLPGGFSVPIVLGELGGVGRGREAEEG